MPQRIRSAIAALFDGQSSAISETVTVFPNEADAIARIDAEGSPLVAPSMVCVIYIPNAERMLVAELAPPR